MDDNKDALLRTAHHEAGHAVVGILEGLFFNTVTIKYNEKTNDSEGGIILHYPKSDKTHPLEIEIAMITALWAGFLAQSRHEGRAEDAARVSGYDYKEIQDRIDVMLEAGFFHSAEEGERFLGWLGYRAGDWIKRDDIWEIISCIAKALLEKQSLSLKEVLEIGGFYEFESEEV